MLRWKWNCVFAVFLTIFYCTESQFISGCSEAIKGKFCLLTCTTPDFRKTVFFTKTSSPAYLAACSPEGLCQSSFPYTIYRSSGSPFETYLNITLLSHAGEEDTYTCGYDYILSVSNSVTIIVRTIPSNVTITLNTTDPIPQEIRGMANCVYPNNVTMDLIYRDGNEDYVLGQFTPSYKGPGSVAGCDSHEYQVSGSFQLTIDTIDNTLVGKAVRFKTRITVYGLSGSQESPLSNSITYVALDFGRGSSGSCRPCLGFVMFTGLLYFMVQFLH